MTWERVATGLALVAAIAGAACDELPPQKKDAGSADVPRFDDISRPDLWDGGGLVEGVAVERNTSSKLSVYLSWETAVPATTELRVECGRDWEQNYLSDALRTQHRVFVMGLWRNVRCRATVRAETESGGLGLVTRRFQVGSPPEVLPELDVQHREASNIRDGWTLTNFSNRHDGIPLIVAIFDSRGRYRWYHRVAAGDSGSDTELRTFRNGVLIGGTRNMVAGRLLDWEGEVVWRDGSVFMHHEIRPYRGDNSFLYLSKADSCPNLDNDGDSIVEYHWEAKRELREWELCDFYTPPEDEGDWAHLNTIEPVPGESAVITSSRNLHTLFKIDLEDEELDWKMGIEGDFGLSDEDRFFRQHDPEILSNGNILVFDNGSRDAGRFSRTWSRALEISYDLDEMEAEAVWSYRPDPDLFAPIWGDADRLDNGNTLVTFGVRNSNANKNSRIVEVTPDGTEVWQVEVPNKWGWYRADRVTDLPVGHVIK